MLRVFQILRLIFVCPPSQVAFKPVSSSIPDFWIKSVSWLLDKDLQDQHSSLQLPSLDKLQTGSFLAPRSTGPSQSEPYSPSNVLSCKYFHPVLHTSILHTMDCARPDSLRTTFKYLKNNPG
ncbi:hypothetical protein GOODEAATRI_015046 [Goodea atripinnis]|uniref:Secreted protein n=1 Tax=Goodea atripinnis TaxID=208336 RepID=A0ABV0N1K0_9TELE